MGKTYHIYFFKMRKIALLILMKNLVSKYCLIFWYSCPEAMRTTYHIYFFKDEEDRPQKDFDSNEEFSNYYFDPKIIILLIHIKEKENTEGSMTTNTTTTKRNTTTTTAKRNATTTIAKRDANTTTAKEDATTTTAKGDATTTTTVKRDATTTTTTAKRDATTTTTTAKRNVKENKKNKKFV